jgi:hypothetical protein
VAVFRAFEEKKFWRFVPNRKVVVGQHFSTNHFGVQHLGNEYLFLPIIGGEMLHHQQT